MSSQSVHYYFPCPLLRALTDSFELRDAELSEDRSPSRDEKIASWRFARQIEVNQTLTILYLIVEASRWQHLKGEDGLMREAVGMFRSAICSRFSIAKYNLCLQLASTLAS